MNSRLRLLLIEDSEDDAVLLRRELNRSGYDPEIKRVYTAEAFCDSLDQEEWDAIIADYTLPDFNAVEALAMMKGKKLDLPFIIVSGTIGEETAVAAMQAGAHDYIMKDNLRRLIPAIERELGDAQIRRERRRGAEALRKSEATYRALFENSPIQTIVVDSEGRVRAVNRAKRLSGDRPPEPGDRMYLDYAANHESNMREELMDCIASRTPKEFPETKYKNEILAIKMSPIPGGALIITEDITHRKRSEEHLTRSNSLLSATLESTPDGIAAIDKDGNLVSSNRKFLKMWQIPDHLLASNNAEEIRSFLREQLKGWDNVLESIDSPSDEGDTMRFDLLECKDGRFFERYAQPQKIGGKIIGTVFSFRDVTERMRTEKKLIEYQEQLRSLASELSLAEQRERRRIADQLHDHIGQALLVSKIKLRELHESLSSTESEAIQSISDTLEKTIQDVRSLTFEISPPVLYMLGFEAAVEWLLEQNEKTYGIGISFECDGHPKNLSDNMRVLLFQIVRELLTNVMKHASAKNVSIRIRSEGNFISVAVEDDGIGFDVAKAGSHREGTSGFGLFSIRERLEHLGGEIELSSSRGKGTRVTLRAPLQIEPPVSAPEQSV